MNDYLLFIINGRAGHSPLLDSLMVLMARDLIFVVVAAAAVCVGLLVYEKQWRPIVFFFVSLVVSYALLKLMSLLNVDHRPFMDHHVTQLIAHASGKSFPSDHTTASAAIAATVLFLTKFKKTGWTLLSFAVLIGFSRVFVGVHYPADIAGGLFTGLLGAGLVYTVVRLASGKATQKSVAFDSH